MSGIPSLDQVLILTHIYPLFILLKQWFWHFSLTDGKISMLTFFTYDKIVINRSVFLVSTRALQEKGDELENIDTREEELLSCREGCLNDSF